ncbi:MAG: hypothetical protein V4694_05490 [Pseudomonadota bacterium]
MKRDTEINKPIPSLMHLIWTGNKPITLERIRDIAKVASFGKSVENGGNAGLEVHLWVEDANKFKILYEKMRVSSSRESQRLQRATKYNHLYSDIGVKGSRDDLTEESKGIDRTKSAVKNAGDIQVLPSELNCVIHSIGELGGNGIGGLSNGLDFSSERGRITEELLMKSEIYKGQGRNKPASASDVIRALILDQKGGVYCDLRVALNFVDSLKKMGLKKFGSMPNDVQSNFLSLGYGKEDRGLGANYAIARPNTAETLKMLKYLYGRILTSHQLEEQPCEGGRHLGMRFQGAHLNNSDQKFMKADHEFYSEHKDKTLSVDSQSRLPDIMNRGYYFGMFGYETKLGEKMVIHTTGWVFDNVRDIRTTSEARQLTNTLFGVDHNSVAMQGEWATLNPSKKSDMAQGVTGMGTGKLNEDSHEFYTGIKEERNRKGAEEYKEWQESIEMEKNDINVKPSTSPSIFRCIFNCFGRGDNVGKGK